MNMKIRFLWMGSNYFLKHTISQLGREKSSEHFMPTVTVEWTKCSREQNGNRVTLRAKEYFLKKKTAYIILVTFLYTEKPP